MGRHGRGPRRPDPGRASDATAAAGGRASHAGHGTGFDERARDWDTAERRQRAEIVAGAVRASVPLTRATRLIDIGAGTGLLGFALSGDVGEVVLAEPSSGMLEVVREKLEVPGGPRNVGAVRFELTVDPPPGEPFDLAVSLLVLHHLEDTSGALRAIRDLLRPGGRIALADLDAEDGSFHEATTEGVHHHGFDRDELGRLAEAAGFTDVEVRTATEIEHEDGRFPVFLLLGRRA